MKIKTKSFGHLAKGAPNADEMTHFCEIRRFEGENRPTIARQKLKVCSYKMTLSLHSNGAFPKEFKGRPATAMNFFRGMSSNV